MTLVRRKICKEAEREDAVSSLGWKKIFARSDLKDTTRFLHCRASVSIYASSIAAFERTVVTENVHEAVICSCTGQGKIWLHVVEHCTVEVSCHGLSHLSFCRLTHFGQIKMERFLSVLEDEYHVFHRIVIGAPDITAVARMIR
jgi:hypothetical protein